MSNLKKDSFAIAIAMLIGGFLLACLFICVVSGSKSLDETQDTTYDHFIITDSETGVQYIAFTPHNMPGSYIGLAPRYKADGSLYVVEDTRRMTTEWIIE